MIREYEDAVDAFVSDYCLVIHHVISDTQYFATKTMLALLAATTEREFPSAEVLTKVVGWTLFTMRERQGHLTADDLAIRDAARRLSDAIFGEPCRWSTP